MSNEKTPCRHNVLRILGDPIERRRVLWVDKMTGRIATIEIVVKPAWPRLESLQNIMEDLEQRVIEIEMEVEHRDLRINEEIPLHLRQKRDLDWAVIQTFVEDEPKAYMKANWTKFICEAVTKNSISRPTVVRILHAYWQRGMNQNALLPLFQNRGGKGKPRTLTGSKLGRPRSPVPLGMPLPPPGINVTQDERRFFGQAIDHEYQQNRKLTLRAAYDRCITMFYAKRVVDPLRPTRTELMPRDGFAETGWPSFEQFQYWTEKDRDLLAVARRRETPRVWDRKNRGLSGTSSAEAWGPGYRFQIDATVADVYLRSKLDRNLLIGRPVVYVVIDVFSRLIAGIYVGLEGPSWIGAMMALANAVADKKAYCASIGIDIDDYEWQAHHLPAFILGDRGEMEGVGIATTLKLFHVTCENAAAWRPDWKGIVESRFRIFQQAFKPYVPGYVDTDFRQRGTTDYRGDAVLNLDEFERIMVRLILYFNNHHELKNFDRHPGMIEDRVPSVPTDIWNWGIAQVGGLPRSPAPEKVRWALMPRYDAVVTDRGILHQSRFYESPRSVRERWSEKVRTAGKRQTVRIGFDKRSVNHIYLADPSCQHGFEMASLMGRSREALDGSGWESEGLLRVNKAMSAAREQDELLRRAETIADNEKEVSIAETASKAITQHHSLSSQVKGARANRSREKEDRRASESKQFLPAVPHYEAPTGDNNAPKPDQRSNQAAKPSYDAFRTKGLENE